MKNTVLLDKHVKLGAKIVDFAGFKMPISYSSVTEEHNHVRENVGVFDVSHMGEFEISGKNSDSCLLYTSPSPRDGLLSRMPASA